MRISECLCLVALVPTTSTIPKFSPVTLEFGPTLILGEGGSGEATVVVRECMEGPWLGGVPPVAKVLSGPKVFTM